MIRRYALKALGIGLLVFAVGGYIWFFTDHIVNLTPSEPVGPYRLTHEPLKRGQIVTFRVLMKHIAALPGDHVRFSPKGVYVNGKWQPMSIPEAGVPRVCPYGDYTVPDNMVLALSDNPDGFDGRYICFLPQDMILSTAEWGW